jgi:nucleotide-binding universal stress UspA family protein
VARRTDVPVLVARPRRRRGRIVAAVDFSDARFPVFTQAAGFASALGASARLLLLHNVDPIGRAFTRGFGIALAPRGLRQLRDSRAEKIHDAAARIAGASAVLSNDHDPVRAIVEHAGRLDADVVVVGAHASSQRHGPFARTANRVVDEVGSSTLIVPLPPRGLVA